MKMKAGNVFKGLFVIALAAAVPLAAIPGDVDPSPAFMVLVHKFIALFV